MIDFQCTHCGHAMRVQQEHGGKHVRCPHCKNVQQVPVAAAAPPPPRSGPSERPPPRDSGIGFDSAAAPSGPMVSSSPSVSARFRKSSKYALQNGIGSIVCAVLGLGANLLCCVNPFLALIFEGVIAVIGILLALNSRSGWKIAGLILNIIVLAWTVLIFILILVGLSARDLQEMV